MSKRAPKDAGFEKARSEAYTHVADVVAAALEEDRKRHGRRFTNYREISQRVGREMNRTLPHILSENDTTISTLSDLAHALGCRLVVRFEYPTFTRGERS